MTSGLGGPVRPDSASFAARVEPYLGRLMAVAMGLCRDADQAEDLVQETLLRAYRGWSDLDPNREPYPWMVRVLRNLHIDSLRSAHSRHEVSGLLMEERCDPGLDPYQELAQSRQIQAVHRALGRLSADQALLLTLVDLQGLSYGEASEVLNLPVGTVRSRLFRGREHLRKLLLAHPP